MNASRVLIATLSIVVIVGLATAAAAQSPGTVLFSDNFEDDILSTGPAIRSPNIGDSWSNKHVDDDYGRGQVASTLDNAFNFIFLNDGSVSAFDLQALDFFTVEGLSHNLDAWNDVDIVLDFSTQLIRLTLNDSAAIVPFVDTTSTIDMFQFNSGGNAPQTGSTTYFDAVEAKVVDTSVNWWGDLNLDGYVDIADLEIVRNHWGQNVTLGDLSSGDASGDGFVGGADLDLVRATWNKGTPPGTSAVPEPSIGILLAGVFLPLLLLRRQAA